MTISNIFFKPGVYIVYFLVVCANLYFTKTSKGIEETLLHSIYSTILFTVVSFLLNWIRIKIKN